MRHMSKLFSAVLCQAVLLSTTQAQWIPTTLDSGTVTCFASTGVALLSGTSDYNGLYISSNNGDEWTRQDNGLTHLAYPVPIIALAVSGAQGESHTIFAGAYGGVFLSSDEGQSWARIDSGFTNTDVYAVSVTGKHLFAGTPTGIYHTTTNGANWTSITVGLGNGWVDAFALYDNNSDTSLYAGTFGSGVFVSHDHGSNWVGLNSGLGNLFIKSFVLVGNEILAGTWGGGVFRLRNGDTSWTSVNDGLFNTRIWSLAALGTNVFAGTEAGLFLSTNGGMTWVESDSGLVSNWVTALAVSEPFLFAGIINGRAGPGGVWRRSLSEMITDVKDRRNEITKDYLLQQNYPNPFNPSTTIHYELPEQSHVELKVYDVLGREITSLLDQTKPAGSYTTQFDASKLSSGVYFYRLQAGDVVQTRRMVVLR